MVAVRDVSGWWRSHLYDGGADVVVLHDGWWVVGAAREPRSVVVDVLDLHDDGSTSTAAGCRLAAAAVVRDDHLKTVEHARLVHGTGQRYDARRRWDAERSVDQPVVWTETTST